MNEVPVRCPTVTRDLNRRAGRVVGTTIRSVSLRGASTPSCRAGAVAAAARPTSTLPAPMTERIENL